MSGNRKTDALALELARAAYETIKPDAAILFGSRARGDHDEHRSDVDIMLIVDQEPDSSTKEETRAWVQEKAETLYGRPVTAQLVWFDRREYENQRRFVNTVVNRALQDGTVMAGEPENYSSRFDDEETEYEYNWTDFDNRLFHAERHTVSFRVNDDLDLGDLLIGEQAQLGLEHALKAVISGHGETYQNTHNLGNLIGRMRQVDSRMASFALEIPADVYTEYAGQDEYKPDRRNPLLTDHANYREATDRALDLLIARARQLGPNRPPAGT